MPSARSTRKEPSGRCLWVGRSGWHSLHQSSEGGIFLSSTLEESTAAMAISQLWKLHLQILIQMVHKTSWTMLPESTFATVSVNWCLRYKSSLCNWKAYNCYSKFQYSICAQNVFLADPRAAGRGKRFIGALWSNVSRAHNQVIISDRCNGWPIPVTRVSNGYGEG